MSNTEIRNIITEKIGDNFVIINSEEPEIIFLNTTDGRTYSYNTLTNIIALRFYWNR